MAVELGRPGIPELNEVLTVLRAWQDDETPLQLHPGDVGWFWRFGAEATAAAVRTWRRGGEVVAVGLLDGPRVLRLAIAPAAQLDRELGHQLTADLTRPERGVLGEGEAFVEAPAGALVRDLLGGTGWGVDEPWTPLRRDLAGPVPDPCIRVDVVDPDRAAERTAVQRAAFEGSTFTDERWRTMAAGPAYADARCLVAYDGAMAVAAVTVWSAGAGRPGLIEPMGVHRDHRGRGHGRAVTVAAAAALRGLGSSSAVVSTPSSNVAAVATYEAAGFRRLAQTRDRRRQA